VPHQETRPVTRSYRAYFVLTPLSSEEDVQLQQENRVKNTSPMKRILVVEDDAAIGDMLLLAIQEEMLVVVHRNVL
jgi:hypothetical protein